MAAQGTVFQLLGHTNRDGGWDKVRGPLLPAGSVLTSATPLPGDLATTLRAPSTCSSRPAGISATYRAEGSLMAFENLAAPQGAAGPTNCFATSRRAG